MKLRQLEYFVRIIDTGSITRASKSLHVAQPALSQQISQLEEELGVKLMARTVRGVSATEAGLAVYHQAKLILKQVEATALVARQAELGPAGIVTIGLPWTVAAVVGLPLLATVRATLKSVRLEIVEGPSAVLAKLLAEGKLDVAVLFDDPAGSGIDMRPLLSEALYFVGRRGSLAGRGGIELAEIGDYPLLLMSRPNGIRELVDSRLALAGVQPQVVAEINSPSLLMEAVRAGLGYAVLPASGIEDSRRAGLVDAVELEQGGLRRTICIGTSRMFVLSLAAEHVIATLAELMVRAVESRRWNAAPITPRDVGTGMDGAPGAARESAR